MLSSGLGCIHGGFTISETTAHLLYHSFSNFLVGQNGERGKQKPTRKYKHGTGGHRIKGQGRPSELKPVQKYFFKERQFLYKKTKRIPTNPRLDYSDEAKLSKIFQKFYYENFKLDDLQDYIIPAFRKIEGAREYFKILSEEATNFGFVTNFV